MDICCTFATSLDTPHHIAIAEQLGYKRAWCYDSPALYADVWMALALAAQRTSTIGLGPAVLIPSLRHVMTNAAAIATLEALAPGRVNVAVGSGFTGRLALGQRPLSWQRVRSYVLALKALLRGEDVEWEGSLTRMLHSQGFAPPRPIDIPVLVGVSGPKGMAVAEEVADGIIGSTVSSQDVRGRFPRIAQMINGTVLDAGESPDSERAADAAGHAAALIYHFAYENHRMDGLPRGGEYAARLDAIPAASRHLALHEGHLVSMNALDREYVSSGFMAQAGRAADVDTWRARLAQAERADATELIYQPAGPDIPRELRAFAAVAGL